MKKRYRKMETAAAMLALGVLLTACGKNDQNADVKKAEEKSVKTEAKAIRPDEKVFKDSDERHEAWREETMQIPEAFRNAYRGFTAKTAAEVLKESSENTVYSPVSLYYALALAASGAEGETKAELLDVLGYENADQMAGDLKLAFEGLYHVPNKENDKPNEWGEYAQEGRYTLKLANSLWADDDLNLKPEFAKNGAESFYADIFSGDLPSEEMQKAKSAWVKEQTNGVIEPAVERGREDQLLSVINTVYFYDEWVTRFNKEKTKEDLFTCENGEEVTCPFMNMEMSSHGFWRGEDYTASSLSLKNGSMTFYLPHEGVNVHELAENAEKLNELLNGEHEWCSGEVIWKLPKFSYGSSLSMKEYLDALGVEAAFCENADFSGISDAETLFVSQILQDAHIGIDEDGVEGAAFTEILYCGASLPTDRAEMILDRPFLYVVENRGTVLFIGICENPAEL